MDISPEDGDIMIEFTIALAGKTISISALHPSTREYCRDYLAEGPADFCLVITQADIDFEREKSAREDQIEGIPVRQFSDAYLETLAVYRKIADKMLEYDTLLFHGSAIAVDGQAYLFTAKSGTGKSTHTRLWRELFGDRVVMVNDDKPLLRVTKDGVMVCGTPWDGKHRISTNVQMPLKGICILSRAKENHIRKLTVAEALPMLLQQSYRSANPVYLGMLLPLLDKLSKSTGLYSLGCNMEPEAAKVAYEGMNRKEDE